MALLTLGQKPVRQNVDNLTGFLAGWKNLLDFPTVRPVEGFKGEFSGISNRLCWVGGVFGAPQY